MKRLLNERFILTLAFGTMIALIIGGLFFIVIPAENANMINIALGFVAGWVSAQTNYYFGDNEKNANTDTDTTQIGESDD